MNKLKIVLILDSMLALQYLLISGLYYNNRTIVNDDRK
jgi:hypothetical protein